MLDLSGVDYISSVGLRVLMLAAKQAKKQGGTVVVANLQTVVREIVITSYSIHYTKLYDPESHPHRGFRLPRTSRAPAKPRS